MIYLKNFLCLSLVLGLWSSVLAQHYKANTPYAFSSDGFTYTLSYDQAGTATLKRSSNPETAKLSKSHVFIDEANFKGFSFINDKLESADIELAPSDKKYWLIPFTAEPQAIQIGGPTTVTIVCSCIYGQGGACSASVMRHGNNVNVTCVPEDKCGQCKTDVARFGDKEIHQSFLLLEADKLILD